MTTPTISVQVTTRREFCAHACQAASVLAIGAMAACAGGPTSPSSTSAPDLAIIPGAVAGRVVSVTIDSASVLASVGGMARILTSLGSFLVARTATDTFTAMTAICTHEGCTVTGFASSRFVCPCHGSQFNTSGGVVNGPASSPLQQFATTFAGGALTFTA
jgi:cytochrome b6-f complex iron-sulfur subunit